MRSYTRLFKVREAFRQGSLPVLQAKIRTYRRFRLRRPSEGHALRRFLRCVLQTPNQRLIHWYTHTEESAKSKKIKRVGTT